MENKEILNKVNSIFKEILDDEELSLSLSDTANDVDEWNSLTHIQIIVEIEKVFGIRFTATEITGFKDVGQLISSIQDKL